MNILAIETATDACAVGVRRGDGVESLAVVDEARRHTEMLTISIRRVLAACELGPRDVDRVVVDRGPGLFTGLRVGIATAVAFAQALGADLVSATSLELLAHGAHDAGVRGPLVAAIDARRGELFVQPFLLATQVRALGDPQVGRAEEITSRWGAELSVAGDGAARYRELVAARGVTVVPARVPSVHAALGLAHDRPPETTVVPLYLRDADAVANFATRTR